VIAKLNEPTAAGFPSVNFGPVAKLEVPVGSIASVTVPAPSAATTFQVILT
jgi:hypothetical protein